MPDRLDAALVRLRALPWGRVALGTLAFLVVVLAVPPFRRVAANVASRGLLFVASPWAPSISEFDALPGTSKILAADGSVLAEVDGGQRRQPTTLKALPRHVSRAVLAAEDADFYHHAGVDPAAVGRAIVRNFQGEKQGASTITQQLAKLNYTGSKRTYFRKLREVMYASRLEEKYSKDELLERYLNQVYFGDGAYGIATAANTFFGVTPEQLTPAQAATLAGKIRSPSGYDPRTRPKVVQDRRNQVLRNMRRHHWLTAAQYREAVATPLSLAPPQPPATSRAPHFVEYVKREASFLDALGGSPESRGKQLFTGGFTIETTLDPKALDAATQSVQTRLGKPGDPAAAVVSVQPGDGAIRVLFSGIDPNQKFDVASRGFRQPGSSFKPFVYLAALEAGIDPRSTMDASSPMTLEYHGEKFVVDNYEGAGGGRSTIDDGLVHSINTVYAQVGLQAGPDNVVRAAEKAGIHKGIRPVPAVALGGLNKGVTPLEMAAAYASFADQGNYAQPYAITRIKDSKGRLVYEHSVKTMQAYDRREVGVLNAQLQRVVGEGTGTAANIGRPVAGKTGTTSKYTNGWFVGYTPQLATAVWVGHLEGDVPMTNVHGRSVSGGSFPAQIFADVMKRALRGVKAEPLFVASPDDLSLHRVDPTTSVPPPTTPPSFVTTTSFEDLVTTTTAPSPSSTTTTAPAPTTTAPPDGGGGKKP